LVHPDFKWYCIRHAWKCSNLNTNYCL
jgi:hypothetical protein